jgi:oxygen-dependent protoporphyrinogen oxidase
VGRGGKGPPLDDDVLVKAVTHEVRAALGLSAPPRAWSVTRWNRALPQYAPGHLDRIERLRSLLPERLVVAGAAYGGVGIGDCIRQGEEAASAIVESLAPAGPAS